MSILDDIRTQLDDRTIDGLARQLGAGRRETETAIGAALPTLLGALARNANRSADGAGSLAAALDRDHDPSLLEQLGGALGGGDPSSGLGSALGEGLGSLLGGSGGGSGGLGDLLGSVLGGGGSTGSGGSAGRKALDGAGILRHVFGDRRSSVEKGLGRTSGLGRDQIVQLLLFLAPLVMSALAKRKRDRDLDAGGLASDLADERREIEKRAPGLGRGGLGSILDRDGDGEVADDLAGIGADLAKAFFNR
jgi:hypothetical protein